MRLLAKGTVPKEQRDDEKRRIQGSRQFGEFAEEWRQTYEIGLKHKAARNKLKRIVLVICKPLHELRFDEIETERVIAVLRKVWHQREISRDTRQRIKKILDAGIAMNLRPKHNPADWDSRLGHANFSGMGHVEHAAVLGLSPHAWRIWRDHLEESGNEMSS